MLTDCAAMLAYIRDHPDDDTARLAYADAVQEAGDEARAELVRVQVELARLTPLVELVAYTLGLNRRTAFIHERDVSRVAVGAHVRFIHGRSSAEGVVRTIGTGTNTTATRYVEFEPVAHRPCEQWRAMTTRSVELFAAHGARWRAGPKCEACGGKKTVTSRWRIAEMDADDFGTSTSGCPACFSTGDAGGLLRQFDYQTASALRAAELGGYNTSTQREPVRVTYHRGTKRVACTLADVCERRHGNRHGEMDAVRWLPTPWALAVCRWHPDVTEFAISDRAPLSRFEGRDWAWVMSPRSLHASNEVPSPIWEFLACGKQWSTAWRYYPSADAANLALARAACRWVHSHLTEPPQ